MKDKEKLIQKQNHTMNDLKSAWKAMEALQSELEKTKDNKMHIEKELHRAKIEHVKLEETIKNM